MLELKNPKTAVPVVLFAGILWSFGPLVVRYMDNPTKFLGSIYLEEGLLFLLFLIFIYILKKELNFGKII